MKQQLKRSCRREGARTPGDACGGLNLRGTHSRSMITHGFFERYLVPVRFRRQAR